MVLVDPVSCRADAGRLGSNHTRHFHVLPCVRYDGSAAGAVQPGPQGGGWRGGACALEGTVRVHVVVPAGFDDPGQPSGGNVYDRRVCAGLAEAGWEVRIATVAAAWPVSGSGARADLARIVSAIPDGET